MSFSFILVTNDFFMRIWIMRIYPRLKKCMSQGPDVFLKRDYSVSILNLWTKFEHFDLSGLGVKERKHVFPHKIHVQSQKSEKLSTAISLK